MKPRPRVAACGSRSKDSNAESTATAGSGLRGLAALCMAGIDGAIHGGGGDAAPNKHIYKCFWNHPRRLKGAALPCATHPTVKE